MGITHQIPFLRHLISGYASGTLACRRLSLVWAVQRAEQLEWVRPFMDSILGMEGRRDVLVKVRLFVTRPRSAAETEVEHGTGSSVILVQPGRPDVEGLLEEEVGAQVGAMAVSVCGPGKLGDGVRQAVRRRVGRATVDFLESAFGW